MDKTSRYLSGRFRDYYRNSDIYTPPEPEKREWAYVRWDGEYNRHFSYFELGEDLSSYFSNESSKDVFFSCAKFDDPGLSDMESKGWIGADLIFDIDAPDLPNVSEEDTYKEKLDKAKDEAIKLIDFLEDDFGYEDFEITFSGGKGFHVHVRDNEVQNLDSSQRIELTKYLVPNNLSLDDILRDDKISMSCYGWIEQFYRNYFNEISKIREGNDEYLERYDVDEIENVDNSVIMGNIKEGKPEYELAEKILEETIKHESVYIDEQVTKDTNRIIRLPTSLHGGSGLKTTRIDKSELSEFEPLTDSIPDYFKNGNEIEVRIVDDYEVFLDGKTRSYTKGDTESIKEYIAIHLMCEGVAELP
jgi:DNA primase small subunit